MNSSVRKLLIAAIAVVAVDSTHAVNINPLSSTLSLKATARAASGGLPAVVVADSASQGAALNPLAAAVKAVSEDGNAYVQATADGTATFGVDSGTVKLSSVGWVARNVQSGSAFLNEGLDFTFTFESLVNGTLSIGYDIVATGSDSFGLNGISLSYGGPAGSSSQFLDANISGLVNQPLLAGETYWFTLKNAANIIGGLGTRNASMDGTFAWRATGSAAVPDAAATLGLLSVSLLGLSLLRRKLG